MSKNKSLAVIVLAAGKGSRMKSAVPKILHLVVGLPMIGHVKKVAESLDPEKIVFVVSPGIDADNIVAPHVSVVQKTPKGTADAVKTVLPTLKGFKGTVLILYGDVPLIRAEILAQLIEHHEKGEFAATILAMAPPNATGYGRIIQNADGTLRTIIEEADATEEQKLIRMCNSGVMAVKAESLPDWIEKIGSRNAQEEFYLTDLPCVVHKAGGKCGVIRGDWQDLQGVNSRAQLAIIEAIAQDRLRAHAMKNGTTLIDPHTVYFAHDTELGEDVTVEPHVFFGPGVKVGNGAIIRAFSHIEGAIIKEGAQVGPYARLRSGTVLEAEAKIGNFVEVKNTVIGKGSKANHLAYLGDATIGASSNIGAGTITCNYDGFDKHKTVIGENVFVGSNSTLVAPLEVADGAYIGAGSTITHDVPSDALAVARERPVIREGWAKSHRAGRKPKKKRA